VTGDGDDRGGPRALPPSAGGGYRSTRTPEELETFIRARTAPAPVPLIPELRLWQATEVTPLWQATAAELAGWDTSPYWAFPWAGGQALARHVLDDPALVRGRRVFDLATGSGLVAIAAARAGAARVIACDTDPFAEAAVRLNAELNGVRLEFRGADPLGAPLEGFDVVLAGDVFYEEPLASRAYAWLAALAAGGARVLAGDPGRLYSPRRGRAGGGISDRAEYDVPAAGDVESRPVLRTWVLEIAR
jgi:predicted nicotinamide N-methyase